MENFLCVTEIKKVNLDTRIKTAILMFLKEYCCYYSQIALLSVYIQICQSLRTIFFYSRIFVYQLAHCVKTSPI